MKILTNILRREKEHFLKLSLNARQLIFSYLFQSAGYPIAGIFLNAFILRINNNPIYIILFTIGNVIALPLAFYTNGILLRKIKIQNLYLVGSMVMGGTVMFLILFPVKIFWIYIIYGCYYGLGQGFYWANRNYLNLQETKSEERNYFLGFSYTFEIIISIISPFIIGWLIVLGEHLGLYSAEQSYYFLGSVALILFSLSGIIVHKNKFDTPSILSINIITISQKWKIVRLLQFAIGSIEGAYYFLTPILILKYLGNEGILGSVESGAALITSICTYWYGKKALKYHRKPAFLLSILLSFVVSILLALWLNWITILITVSASYFLLTLVWLTNDPIIMDIIDKEIQTEHSRRYSYIFDRELFLNIGRLTSLVTSLLFFIFLGNLFAYQFTFLASSIIGFIALTYSYRLYVLEKNS